MEDYVRNEEKQGKLTENDGFDGRIKSHDLSFEDSGCLSQSQGALDS